MSSCDMMQNMTEMMACFLAG